jgi:hypothetical protein
MAFVAGNVMTKRWALLLIFLCRNLLAPSPSSMPYVLTTWDHPLVFLLTHTHARLVVMFPLSG